MKKHTHAYGMVSVYCKKTRVVVTARLPQKAYENKYMYLVLGDTVDTHGDV